MFHYGVLVAVSWYDLIICSKNKRLVHFFLDESVHIRVSTVSKYDLYIKRLLAYMSNAVLYYSYRCRETPAVPLGMQIMDCGLTYDVQDETPQSF